MTQQIATVFINQGSVGTYWPFWASWLVLFLVFEFNELRVEKKKLAQGEGATFSDLVWRVIRGRAWYHRVLYGVLLAFFLDLGLHFFVGTHLF